MRPMTPDEYARYYNAAHAVQAGTKYQANREHLGADQGELGRYIDSRIGLNCIMAEFAGLGQLFVDKGLVTADEYYEAITKGLLDEKARLEAEAEKHYGVKVNFV